MSRERPWIEDKALVKLKRTIEKGYIRMPGEKFYGRVKSWHVFHTISKLIKHRVVYREPLFEQVSLGEIKHSTRRQNKGVQVF